MSVKVEAPKRKYASTAFPKKSLMECLKIAESIKANNNLQPYNRLTLASSLDTTPSSSAFRNLITHSASYGLTTGSYIADKIGLTALGTKIVSPKSDAERNEGLKSALFNIPLFEKFFKAYNNGNMPRKDLLLNTLNRDYNIPLPDCEACYGSILKNAQELGILVDIKGKQYIQLDKLSSSGLTSATTQEEEEPLDSTDEELPSDELSNGQLNKENTTTTKPKVFISHSKNKKIVEQIKAILRFGQFEPVIAEERETTAITIAEKVFGLMKTCNCAIINLSVDDQEQADGGFQINPNVLIEIGAALIQYDKRVILLMDKRFSAKLPSNLHGLYRSEYEGDALSFETAMKLQEALSGFRA